MRTLIHAWSAIVLTWCRSQTPSAHSGYPESTIWLHHWSRWFRDFHHQTPPCTLVHSIWPSGSIPSTLMVILHLSKWSVHPTNAFDISVLPVESLLCRSRTWVTSVVVTRMHRYNPLGGYYVYSKTTWIHYTISFDSYVIMWLKISAIIDENQCQNQCLHQWKSVPLNAEK